MATPALGPAKTTENPSHEFHFDNNIDNHNNNIDDNDNHYYYYDQYDGVAEVKEDDVVYNDYQVDYNYQDYQHQQEVGDYNDYGQVEDYNDYKDEDARRTTGVMCPGSLDQCIEACVPLQDIYVYSLCVVECGKRCN